MPCCDLGTRLLVVLEIRQRSSFAVRGNSLGPQHALRIVYDRIVHRTDTDTLGDALIPTYHSTFTIHHFRHQLLVPSAVPPIATFSGQSKTKSGLGWKMEGFNFNCVNFLPRLGFPPRNVGRFFPF